MGASAHEYLHIIGLIIYSYMWVEMGAVALKSGNQLGEYFDEAKLQAARFFTQLSA
ncbi:acyl-CoA dehydrogenase C-terminal domain-containing protein [Zhongshania antarctica]